MGACLLVLALPIAGQQAVSQIRTEIERQQRVLKDTGSGAGYPSLVANAGELLKAADAALGAGQLYLSLEILGQATDLWRGAQAVAERPEVVKGGMPAFESRREKIGVSLTALEKEARERDWSKAPLAVRVLSETAQNKILPLLDGGRGFAASTKPEDGLFNIGEAAGEAEFAKFCATLRFSGVRAAIPLRSMLPELEGLQKKTNAAFQPPRSVKLHSRFIALNSTLKFARELDADKFYAAALYQYLEAVRHYGLLDAPELDAGGQSRVKADIAAARKKLDAGECDDSIAQLFLERAASYVAHADGSAPSADEWRGARVIIDQVLPAYRAALKAAPPAERAPGKTVEVALVRWPYT